MDAVRVWVSVCVLIGLLAGTASAVNIETVTVIFVDDDAAPGGNGQTWGTAYKNLQDALDAARALGGAATEVWVAAGTYKPDQGLNQTPGDRAATFQLTNGVALRGGFAGNENPATFDLSRRHFIVNETILSGDLLGDDNENVHAEEPTRLDNAYSVVTGNGTEASAILDGCTITGGNATSWDPYEREGSGGGILNLSGSPVLSYCTFTRNSSSFVGAAVFNSLNSAPRLSHCVFSKNWAPVAAGGVANRESNPVLNRCTFSRNAAAGGAAVSSVQGSSVSATYCTFVGNTAAWGGAVENDSDALLSLVNCNFIGNSATGQWGGYPQPYKEGGSVYDWGGVLSIAGCTFSKNQAPIGSAIYVRSFSSAAETTLADCIVWGNGALGAGQIAGSPSARITISYSCMQGGWPGTGNIDGDPMVIRTPGPGSDGMWGTGDDDYGDLRLWAGSPCIDAGDNDAPGLAGITTDLGGNPRFVDDPATDPDPGNGTPPIVDMGAYEYDPAGDYDGDGVLNGHDQCPNTIPAATVDATGCPPYVRFDFDRDGDVDGVDSGVFEACATGPGVTGPPVGCNSEQFGRADADADTDVDQSDFGVFQRCIGGQDNATDPDCAN